MLKIKHLGWTESNEISDEVMDIARWSASQLSAYTNGNDHTIMTVKNLKTQIVSGKNYVFTLEVVASLPENKYAVSLYFDDLSLNLQRIIF